MRQEQLAAAIAAQEQLRGVVPDEVVDAAIGAIRAQVDDEPEQSQRRRQVTVLFADVSGFTAMSESLDPEIVAELMNRLWAELDRVVVEEGGRVDKHIGDALMAVWGAEVVAEDDAERAVRASLVMQSEILKFSVSSGQELRMRVGVNTGPVLVGPVGSTHEFTVMGDAVNTASRLEHSAPSGGVLISHDTYRQVRGVFDVRALDPLTVKGKTDPLRVYVAIAVKPRAFRLVSRGVEGVETSTIGRDDEIAALCAAFERVVATGACHRVVVVGEAGVGKSRLLYEFDNWLELHELAVFYFKARASRARTSARFGLWRDLLAFRAEVTDSDSPRLVFEKLRAETSEVLDDREVLILGLWLGFELAGPPLGPGLVSGENMATVGRAYLVAYLQALMSEAPVVMLFEDLHWADSESLQLLRELPDLVSDGRLLLVAAARPDHTGSGPADSLNGTGWDLIALSRLSDRAARAMVFEVLKNARDIPRSLVDLVVDRADGNPFYIEELIRKLMDDGIIETGHDEQWIVRAELMDHASIPTTLTGVLEARLDTVPKATRQSLQRASVVGRTFWDQAIEALEPGTPDLEPAVARELVLEHQSSTFLQCSEFAFKHALLHDVVYNTVLLSDRPGLHQRTADWLALTVGDRRDEYLEEIANHLLLAGLNVEASDMLLEAAARALDAGDPSSARRLSKTGFDARASSPASPRAHIVLASAFRRLGDLAAAAEEADLAVGLAQRNGDDVTTVAALHEAFYVTDAQGNHEQGLALVQVGLPLAERVGGSSLVGMLACCAWSDLNAGDLDSAQQNADACLSRAEEDGDLKNRIEAHKIAGVITGECANYEASFSHYRHIQELASQSGDLIEVALCHLNTGVSWHLLADSGKDPADYDRAEEEYEAALALTRRLGMSVQESTVLGNLAQLRIRRGLLDSAQTLAEECLVLCLANGSRIGAIFAILVHAEARYAKDSNPQAVVHIGVVAKDPGVGRVKAEIADVVDRIRHSGPDFDMDEALASGESLTFDDVVHAILGDHYDSGL